MKSRQIQMFQIYISLDPKEDLTFEEALEKGLTEKERKKA